MIKSKPIIDQIDRELAKHYRFIEDEFIFSQIKSLKDDWEAPGMEVYDKL